MLKEIGSWRWERSFGFAETADTAEAALEAAAKLKVKNLPGRFGEYLPLLREAAPIRSAPLPWPARSREHALFYEGITQVGHLLKAAEVWPSLPPKDARHKLTKALAGNAIPVPGSDVDRQARDFMAEFSAAWALQRRGLQVAMPCGEGREDLRTSIREVGELLVECKRPESMDTIGSNLEKAYWKLAGTEDRAGLCDGESTLGLIVVAIDRVLDGSVIPAAFPDLLEIPSFREVSDLAGWLDSFHGRLLEDVRTQSRARLPLFPKVPLFGLLLSVPVFVQPDAAGGELHVIESLDLFNTGTSWQGMEALKKVFFEDD